MNFGRFTVVNHNYVNTGGNTMLSIFTVYDSTANAMRYVIANDNRFWLQTADTVSSPLLDEDGTLLEKVVLGSWEWNELVTDPLCDQQQFEDDEWKMFKYCQFEFYKKDCKYFGIKVNLSLNELPTDLYVQLPLDYILWAEKEGAGCLTDGYEVYMEDGYEPPVDLDELVPLDVDRARKLQDIKDFSKWLKQINYDPILLGSYITICVAGDSVKIPLHADSYDLLDRFLDKVIEEF